MSDSPAIDEKHVTILSTHFRALDSTLCTRILTGPTHRLEGDADVEVFEFNFCIFTTSTYLPSVLRGHLSSYSHLHFSYRHLTRIYHYSALHYSRGGHDSDCFHRVWGIKRSSDDVKIILRWANSLVKESVHFLPYTINWRQRFPILRDCQ